MRAFRRNPLQQRCGDAPGSPGNHYSTLQAAATTRRVERKRCADRGVGTASPGGATRARRPAPDSRLGHANPCKTEIYRSIIYLGIY